MKNISYLWLSVLVLVLDQITKAVIRAKMTSGQSLSVIGDFFRITYTQNTGAAFSFSLGSPSLNRTVFLIVTVLAVTFVLFLLRHSQSRWQNVAFGLIIGGALGNWIDRLRIGSVTDFLDFDFPDVIMYRFPVFNVADSALVIAMIMLVIYILFLEKKYHTPQA